MRREEKSEEREARKIKGGNKKKSEIAQGEIIGFKKGREKVIRGYELTTVMNNYNNKKTMNINQMMRSNEEINKIEKY